MLGRENRGKRKQSKTPFQKHSLRNTVGFCQTYPLTKYPKSPKTLEYTTAATTAPTVIRHSLPLPEETQKHQQNPLRKMPYGEDRPKYGTHRTGQSRKEKTTSDPLISMSYLQTKTTRGQQITMPWLISNFHLRSHPSHKPPSFPSTPLDRKLPPHTIP